MNNVTKGFLVLTLTWVAISFPLAAQSCTDTMLASIGAISDSQVLDDGTYIYFGDETGRLLRVPVAGGSVQVLATIPGSGTIGVSGIYVDSTNAYFGTNGKPGPAGNPSAGTGAVWVVPLTGGTAVSLASGLSTVTQIKGDATNIYVAVAGSGFLADGQIMNINKTSRATQVLAQGLVTPISLDVDSSNVYFGQYPILGGTGGVSSVAKTGGSVKIINSSKPAYYVALDSAGSIFFTSGLEEGVYKASLSTGALTTLASGTQFGSVEALPVNGYVLYSTDNNCGTGVGVGAQFSYASAGGGASTLYKTSNCASFFTVDNVAMYASVRPSTTSGQIWKFCLPAALVSSSTGAPIVPSNGTVGGASYTTSLAAAGITSIFGTNFASGNNQATAVPLPTTLGGVTVKLNGIAAPLFFVGAGQINFQMPWELLGQTTATLTVTNAAGTSTPLIISLSGVAPGIFSLDSSGKGQGAIQLANTGTFAAPAGSIPGASAQPVSRGNYVTIYCSGLGAVSNQPATGVAAAGGNALSNATGNVTVMIGGQDAPVNFAGLAPGFVGLYQVNAQVASSATPGNAVPVMVTVNGTASNTVTIAVQ